MKDIELNESQLSYHKFAFLMDLYISMPLIKKKDANNSDNLRKTLGLFEQQNFAQIPEDMEEIIKWIHYKIEQKYKNYKEAFKAIDINRNGIIEFREFFQGLDEMGLLLKLENTKRLFDYIDSGNKNKITFKDFLKINYEAIQIK